ncbi:class II aldolase/adducin family protein [bacterium]|nr:class II aldolase/adducin family protein [bacterium]
MKKSPEDSYQNQIVELIAAGKRLDERQLISGTEGNLSVRLPNNRILITGSGKWKGRLSQRDFVLLSADGEVLKGDVSPSSETALHISAYELRKDIQAVIHAHPPHVIAATLAGISLEAVPLPEAAYMLGSVPTCKFAVPGTKEGGEVIRERIGKREAVLLDRHGAVTVGKTLEQALMRMETLENVAKAVLLANSQGFMKQLSSSQIDRISTLALKMGVCEESIQVWGELQRKKQK